MTVQDLYHQFLTTYRKETIAAKHVMDTVPEPIFDQLNELAEQATFERRRYGTQWYTWAYHDKLEQPRDPWPASRYPKALLCVEIGKDIVIPS